MCISAAIKKKSGEGCRKKKNEVKLEFLTLEKSLKMFLVCTLMDQKAEGKEKKKRRSLKMPWFLRCDICFCSAPGWQEELPGGCGPGRKQVRSPNGLRCLRFAGVGSMQSLFRSPAPRRAADCHRLFAGDKINTCVCALKLSCWLRWEPWGYQRADAVILRWQVVWTVACCRAAGGPK